MSIKSLFELALTPAQKKENEYYRYLGKPLPHTDKEVKNTLPPELNKFVVDWVSEFSRRNPKKLESLYKVLDSLNGKVPSQYVKGPKRLYRGMLLPFSQLPLFLKAKKIPLVQSPYSSATSDLEVAKEFASNWIKGTKLFGVVLTLETPSIALNVEKAYNHSSAKKDSTSDAMSYVESEYIVRAQSMPKDASLGTVGYLMLDSDDLEKLIPNEDLRYKILDKYEDNDGIAIPVKGTLPTLVANALKP